MANRVQDGLCYVFADTQKLLRSARNNGLAIIASLDRQTKSWNLRRSTNNAQLRYNGFRSSFREFFAKSEPSSVLLLFKRLIYSTFACENAWAGFNITRFIIIITIIIIINYISRAK